ncbi:MAG: RluA family pseudouridine synthase [Chitinophagales bacterium]
MKNPVIEILYADEDMLVVNKPSGIPVIPERFNTEKNNSLQNLLEKEFGKLFIVHRIDRGTSGALCFARNEAAHRNLSMQFQEHTVKKYYLAIVTGRLKESSGTIDAPIGESNSRKGSMVISKQGKAALSHYELVEDFKHASVVRVQIETGRTHQVRVHLAYIGNPLLVDELYGSTPAFYFSSIKRGYKQTDEEERPTIARLTLHASELSLQHPVSNEKKTFTAPLPKDLETVLKLLRKYDK